MTSPKPGASALAPGLAGRLNPVCDRFEDRWASGASPRLEEFLHEVEEADRPALVRELLHLELHYRFGRGDRPTIEEYRLRLPDFVAFIDEQFVETPDATHTRQADRSVRDVVAQPVTAEETCDAVGDDGTGIVFSPPAVEGEAGTLGPYRILKRLGVGGMGAVYAAVDTRLNRKLAIKVMLPRYAQDGAARERFLREAHAAAQVAHDNVITVYEADVRDGVPYIAMQWLPGCTLEDVLRHEAALPIARILQIGREAALGLAAAHRVGCVHRDVKPANLWIEAPSGRVKVLDFGLARPVQSDVHLTASGTIVGTPAYMSPEQGRGLKVDRLTDLFSLGVVLYRLCTGKLPFEGPNTMAMLTALGIDEPRPVRELNPETPESLAALIHQLLAKNPADRPQSAEEVAARLDAIADDVMVKFGSLSHRVPTSTQEAIGNVRPKTSRRVSPHWWIVLAASLLVVAIGIASYKLYFETEKGTLVVEVEGDADVRFKSGELQVYDADGKLKYTLAPGDRTKDMPAGKYTVRVVGADGVKLDTPEFTMTRDGAKLRVYVEKPALKATPKQDPPDIAKDKGPEVIKDQGSEADRQAALYVLSVGGAVTVNGEYRSIHDPNQLPMGRLSLSDVDLLNNKRLTNAGLAVFGGCTQLRSLLIGNSAVTDEGLAHFANCRELTHLSIGNLRITDAGLVYFKDAKKLEQLSLGYTGITDAGLRNFIGCKKLRNLGLAKTKVGDSGLAYFKDCEKLSNLDLSSTLVTNEGIALFKKCYFLNTVELTNTSVSDEGILHFKDCRQLSHLYLNKTSISDAGLAHLKNCNMLMQIHLNETRVTDRGVAALKFCNNLTQIFLEGTQVEMTAPELNFLKDCSKLNKLVLNNTPLSDAGLMRLKDCKGLILMEIKKTKVTTTGIEEFHKALPKCHILYDGGVILPQ